jgi:putative ABC transport system permease protein
MMLQLAWQNVVHKKWRAAASLGGVAFSILLMFMQFGIFSAAERSADIVFNAVDFDLVLTSPQYVFMVNAGSLKREVAVRAKDVPGIESASPMFASFTLIRSIDDKLRRGILLLGIDPKLPPMKDPVIREQAYLLNEPDTTLMDREARGEFGPREVGTTVDLGFGHARIVGDYKLGTGFIAGADAIVSDHTYCRLLPGRRTDRPNLIFLKAKKGQSIEMLALRMRNSFGPDVRVWTKSAIIQAEQNYFVNIKPIGIMFRSGVVVGFLVGAVTLYQILSTQVASHIKELATMKAMGYSDAAVYSLVVLEGFIYALIGFVPAYIGGEILYKILREAAKVPVSMTIERAVIVLFLTLVMCAISSLLAARRVRTADPAELFA